MQRHLLPPALLTRQRAADKRMIAGGDVGPGRQTPAFTVTGASSLSHKSGFHADWRLHFGGGADYTVLEVGTIFSGIYMYTEILHNCDFYVYSVALAPSLPPPCFMKPAGSLAAGQLCRRRAFSRQRRLMLLSHCYTDLS